MMHMLRYGTLKHIETKCPQSSYLFLCVLAVLVFQTPALFDAVCFQLVRLWSFPVSLVSLVSLVSWADAVTAWFAPATARQPRDSPQKKKSEMMWNLLPWKAPIFVDFCWLCVHVANPIHFCQYPCYMQSQQTCFWKRQQSLREMKHEHVHCMYLHDSSCVNVMFLCRP